jgi:hypothetical protein
MYIPSIRDALAAALVVAFVLIGVQTVRLNHAKKRIEGYEVLEMHYQRAGQHVMTLRAAIEKSNKEIEEAKNLGVLAEKAQAKADQAAERAAWAEQALTTISERYRNLANRTDTPCETYREVLKELSR